VRRIGIIAGIIITVTADERQHYEKGPRKRAFLFVTICTNRRHSGAAHRAEPGISMW
jgi:hypothetical protein